ncbi:MAG: hypothetical protein OXC60_17340 [Litoreibacter sp.]|nr:hypothetical protein [Litoreibacter sp.]
MSRIVLTPVEEVSFRARKDKGMMPCIIFLGWSLLVWALMIALMVSEDITDLTRFGVFAIASAANAVIGYLAYSFAWFVFRYKGDKQVLMRVGFYFAGLYTVFLGLLFVLQNGAFKVLAPEFYEAYFTALNSCDNGILEKMRTVGRISAEAPAMQTVNTVLGATILIGVLIYWISSIRVYLGVFHMPRWRCWGSLIFGSVLWVGFMWVPWLILISLGRPINGC